MSIADDLKSLQELHDKGQLTDDEYAAAKAAALKGGTRKPMPSFVLPVAVSVFLVAAILVVWRMFIYQGPQPSSSAGNAMQAGAAKAMTKSASPVVTRAYSSQEIFQMASGGMVLVEAFDDEGRKRSQGSAFVVSADGTAITNYHVIRGASRATGKYGDGTWSEVSGVIGYDPARDVAVIRLATPPKTILKLGDSDTVQVGEKVVAIGSPLGFQNTLSEGIVSGLRNGVIQMSDPISPGSSGGAVFDSADNVVGISVATVAPAQNLNFAVPINWAKPYLTSTNVSSLKDVATENAVTQDILDGSVMIPPAQGKVFPVTLNPNVMSNAEIHGQVTSSGGMDGKITVTLLFNNQPIYNCRSTSCEIHQPIGLPGVYQLVLDNRISPMFGRTVNGQVALKYVK